MSNNKSVKGVCNSFITNKNKSYTLFKDKNKYPYYYSTLSREYYHKQNSGYVLSILKLVFLVLIIVALFRFFTNITGTMSFTEFLNGLSSVPDIFTPTIESFKGFNEFVADIKLLDWFGIGELLSLICSVFTIIGYLITSLIQLALFVGYFALFLFA